MKSLLEAIPNLLIIACVALFLILTGWLCFALVDSACIEDQAGIATIVDRGYQAPWTQFIHHSDGKGGGWNQIIHHPESWSITVKMGDATGCFQVSERTHDSAIMGRQIPVRYGKGRISGSTYITTASFD